MNRNPFGINKEVDDPYLVAIYEQWPKILGFYQLFASKNPIVLYDLQEQKIYTYPYKEFKADLNPRSQASLTEQYEAAIQNDQIVVFVRDNQKRKLRSYTLNIE